MQRMSPEASRGFSRFEASITPPDAAPAPMMVWISSMKRIAPSSFCNSPSSALKRFSKSPAVLGAGQERAEVQGEYAAVGHHIRHLLVDDALGEAFGNGRLAYAGFAHQKRIVLAPPAQHLNDPFHLQVAAYQRIDLAGFGQLVQIAREVVERRLAAAFALLLGRLGVVAGAFVGGFGDAVRDVVHHVQAAMDCSFKQCTAWLSCSAKSAISMSAPVARVAALRLHMEDGSMHHALEAQRRFRLALVAGWNQRRVLVYEGGELRTQCVDVGAYVLQHLVRFLLVKQREQDVFWRHELVSAHARLLERLVHGDLQLFGKH